MKKPRDMNYLSTITRLELELGVMNYLNTSHVRNYIQYPSIIGTPPRTGKIVPIIEVCQSLGTGGLRT